MIANLVGYTQTCHRICDFKMALDIEKSMSHTFFLFLLTAEQGCYSVVPNWFLGLSGVAGGWVDACTGETPILWRGPQILMHKQTLQERLRT